MGYDGEFLILTSTYNFNTGATGYTGPKGDTGYTGPQ
jgi:hypothetical protein